MSQGKSVIIAGSRSITDYKVVKSVINKLISEGLGIVEVISGCTMGVSKSGEKWANENGIVIKRFPAEWEKYRIDAHYIRNEEMIKQGEVLVLIYDGKSKGSKHLWDIAKREGLEIHVFDKDGNKIIQ